MWRPVLGWLDLRRRVPAPDWCFESTSHARMVLCSHYRPLRLPYCAPSLQEYLRFSRRVCTAVRLMGGVKSLLLEKTFSKEPRSYFRRTLQQMISPGRQRLTLTWSFSIRITLLSKSLHIKIQLSHLLYLLVSILLRMLDVPMIFNHLHTLQSQLLILL